MNNTSRCSDTFNSDAAEQDKHPQSTRKDASRRNMGVAAGGNILYSSSPSSRCAETSPFGSLPLLERGKRAAGSFPSVSARLCVPGNLINDKEGEAERGRERKRERESGSAQLISHVRSFNPRPAELGWNGQVSRLFPLIPRPREFPVYMHTREVARREPPILSDPV